MDLKKEVRSLGCAPLPATVGKRLSHAIALFFRKVCTNHHHPRLLVLVLECALAGLRISNPFGVSFADVLDRAVLVASGCLPLVKLRPSSKKRERPHIDSYHTNSKICNAYCQHLPTCGFWTPRITSKRLFIDTSWCRSC